MIETKAYKIPSTFDSDFVIHSFSLLFCTDHWIPSPIYFDRDMWLDPSSIAGAEILEPTIDHDLLGFDVRTLPLEERDWTINDDREVPWPMSKPPAQAQDEGLAQELWDTTVRLQKEWGLL